MLFDEKTSTLYREKISSFLDGFMEDSDYVRVIATQLQDVLRSNIELVRYGNDVSDYQNTVSRISGLLDININLDVIESAHFEIARLLRIYSFGGVQDHDSNEVVLFYLWPKFEQIKQKNIDAIRFDIPSEFTLRPYKADLEKIRAYVGQVEAWEDKLSNWKGNVEAYLEGWENRVFDSGERLKEINTEQNYLGLAHAFKVVSDNKKAEARSVWYMLLGLAFLAVTILFAQAAIGVFAQAVHQLTLVTISTVIFAVAADMLVLYFFRLSYLRWAELKRQISQLELRGAMCAFVHDYAESSKDLDRGTLSKFENMVFSEIFQDNVPPPSLYDAADSMAKLLAAWKKPSA